MPRKVLRWSMEATRVTEFLAGCLLLSVTLVFPAVSQPLTALTGPQFNRLPPPIPSFVYYRDAQPQTPQRLLFSPINTPYSQYLLNNNLRDSPQPTPSLPGALRLSILNPGLGTQRQGGYQIRENYDDRFETINNNGFAIPARNAFNIPAINDPGFILQRYNGLATSVGNNFASQNDLLQSFGQPSPAPIHQISLLRYASSFPRTANQEEDLGKVLRSLRPSLEQRQRSTAEAGELVYRQQRAGAKPFLSSSSEGVQREGGEELSSPGGFLGLPYRRPTFVSAVGTPVSGVGQNPLYTGDSVQASKLDEASDVKGVKSPGGIPSPGRHPVSQDVHFARPFVRYANNFGYSAREGPVFNPLAPHQFTGRGPLALSSEAYTRGVINR